jgi:hypothetical protein
MPYWTCRLQPSRANLALNLLRQFGYRTYYPLIAAKRSTIPVALFPGYCFIVVQPAWWQANSCPGVIRLLRGNGERLPRSRTISLTRSEGVRIAAPA